MHGEFSLGVLNSFLELSNNPSSFLLGKALKNQAFLLSLFAI